MKKYLSLLLLLLFTSLTSFSQIKIKELQFDESYQTDSINFSNTLTRQFVPLNSDWKVYNEDSEDLSAEVNIPASFSSSNPIIFKKVLDVDTTVMKNHLFRIHFLGVSYLVEIYLNDLILSKRTGGNIPFSIDIPNELLSVENTNVLTLKLVEELDSKSTIPLKQRFLFPKHSGGILREVFLEIYPKENLELQNYSVEFNSGMNRANIFFDFSFNYIFEKRERTNYRLGVTLIDQAGNIAYERKLYPDRNKEFAQHNINIRSIDLWSPENPNNYVAKFSLTKKDSLVDEIQKNLVLYKVEKSEKGMFLNGESFTMQGVSYIISSEQYGNLTGYSKLLNDLEIIKNMGVNTVFFAKDTPHPFALNICQKLGLFVLIEIPINSIPERFTNDPNYKDRAKDYLKDLYQAYGKHRSLLGIGLGSSYLSDSKSQIEFISDLSNLIKDKKQFTFASFVGFPEKEINNLDLYGIELYSPEMNKVENRLTNCINILGSSNIFISSATYPSYNGNTNGYLNKYSIEGQAKFFEEIIDLSRSTKISGFFVNSMFDYYGEYNSLYTKYSTNNHYQIGILGPDRNINRIGYNVIKSKLKSSNRITIPLGSKTEDPPLFFILVGLLLSILMGVLVNSKKKFREDALRALLRPYNFFADIRDHRIMSGVHTSILLFILVGAHALLINNLFFYSRTSLYFDKFLIALGNPSIIDFVSYFAWNPVEAFFLLSGISFGLFILISFIIKWASFFIKTKIYYRNILFTIVWAFLPVVILLPLAMVLFRILEADLINLYIYIFLGIYFIWTIQRLLKGVYVIFDISSLSVYFYSLVLIIILLGGVLFYFQFSYASIDYIINTFNQFQHM